MAPKASFLLVLVLSMLSLGALVEAAPSAKIIRKVKTELLASLLKNQGIDNAAFINPNVTAALESFATKFSPDFFFTITGATGPTREYQGTSSPGFINGFSSYAASGSARYAVDPSKILVIDEKSAITSNYFFKGAETTPSSIYIAYRVKTKAGPWVIVYAVSLPFRSA
eukprot:TRINITY_DN811_c2_g1_i1.p1 TRINITY_DN811_c2_g1~~TRINITY_DN811_c2_g1_i1.p1  ORF type:complete len:187 (-),score=32.91 TRINITY_DN811_c2_g1_i1:18-524(-)